MVWLAVALKVLELPLTMSTISPTPLLQRYGRGGGGGGMGAMGGAGLGMAGGLMGGMLLANAFDDDGGGYDGGDGGGGDDGGGGEVSTRRRKQLRGVLNDWTVADFCTSHLTDPRSKLPLVDPSGQSSTLYWLLCELCGPFAFFFHKCQIFSSRIMILCLARLVVSSSRPKVHPMF